MLEPALSRGAAFSNAVMASAPPHPDDEGRRKLSRYTLLRHLGSGRFAEVGAYRADDTGAAVAIKKVLRESHAQGVSLGAVKELQVLQELRGHPNLLALLDAFTFGDRVHLVLELCEHDLAALALDTRTPLPEAAVKGIVQQLLRGLAHMHAARFMHRDIKPENVLVAAGGVCKLADFGLAAAIDGGSSSGGPRPLHPGVVTLFYRAPELLLRAATHGPAVDLWSVGCVLAELLLRQPLFPCEPRARAEEEAAQLAAIARLLGAPVDPASDAQAARRALAAAGLRQADLDAMLAPGGAGRARGLAAPLPLWPGCAALPGMPTLPPEGAPGAPAPQPWRAMHAALAGASSAAVDLLSRLVVWDPLLRLTAEEALAHPWFASPPAPALPSELPRAFAAPPPA